MGSAGRGELIFHHFFLRDVCILSQYVGAAVAQSVEDWLSRQRVVGPRALPISP